MNDERFARIQAEYREMPGLKLTAAQASRFWHLDPHDSRLMLDKMVEAGALFKTDDGHYVLLAGSARV